MEMEGIKLDDAKDTVNILLVDDQPEGLTTLEAILSRLGQNLIKASSGREALRQILANDFAVILLDVQMPGMDGYETATLIRDRQTTRHIPLIFLTAHFESDVQTHRGYHLGAVDYLYKPLDPEVLRSKVSVFIELARKSALIQRQAAALAEREAEARHLAATQAVLLEDLKRANLELRDANLKAEQASHHKSRFLANMSHEIRTPLSGVIGIASLLRETTMTPEQCEWVDTILASGKHLVVVLNDILDMSKVEAGHLTIESAPFDVVTATEDAVDIAASQLHHKEVEVELVVCINPSTVRSVIGDEARYRQIVLNLLSNAIKFTKKGEIVVELSAAMDGDKVLVNCAVTDTGIGIAPENMERIFDAFRQADSSTTRRFGGTGLGLAISKHLCQLMDGQLVAESCLGQGSTFRLTCRFAPGEVVHEAESTAGLEGRQVLVVDENASSLQCLQSQLGTWGVRVTATQSPVEALKVVGAGARFAAAIVNHRAPALDGEALAAKLEMLDRTMPILLLTWVEPTGEARTGGGIAVTIRKPVRRAGLGRALVNAMAQTKPALLAPQAPAPRASKKTMTILVAEDDMMNQKVVSTILHKLGYEVDMVSTGAEAFQAVQRKAYDLVLMDVNMPEMDGVDATLAIRKNCGNPHVPWIVALTAAALDDELDRCRAAGMNDHLAKPYTRAELIALLDRVAARLSKPDER